MSKEGIVGIIQLQVYSFILKTELIRYENFLTRRQANEKIFEYIEIFYNRQRLHSSNNYLSPSEFEEKMLRLEIIS